MELNKDTVDAYMEDTIGNFLSMDGILDSLKGGEISLKDMVSSFERILIEKVPELGVNEQVELPKIIKDTISDTISKFLYYDRKECESIPLGEIESNIKNGKYSTSDLSSYFKNQLDYQLPKDN